MLQKKFTKKRILGIGLTMVVSATILAGAISNRYSLYAKPTLPGIETYIDQNSPNTPMVLVEVVPDKSVARLGYLVAGEEPVDDSGKSIHDMPAKNEREVRFSNANTANAANTLLPENLKEAVSYSTYLENISGVDTYSIVDIYGAFAEGVSGSEDYKLSGDSAFTKIVAPYTDASTNPVTEITEYYNVVNYLGNVENKTLYRKYGNFKQVDSDSEGTKYAIDILQKVDDDLELPVLIDKLGVSDSTKSDEYYYQYFSLKIIEDNDDFENGDLVFVISSSGDSTYAQYVGTVDSGSSYSIRASKPSDSKENNEVDEENQILDNEDDVDKTTDNESDDEDKTTDNELDDEDKASENEKDDDDKKSDNNSEDVVTDDQASIYMVKLPVYMTELEDGNVKTIENDDELDIEKEENENDEEDDVEENDETVNEDEDNDELAGGVSTFALPNSNGFTVPDIQDGNTYAVLSTDTKDGDLYCVRFGDDEDEQGIQTYDTSYKANCFVISDIYQVEPRQEENDKYPEYDASCPYFYLRNENSEEYEYVSGAGDYYFTSDYAKEKVSTARFTGGFKNQEWFKKYVLDIDDEEILNNMIIDVVTVTPDELTVDLVEKADLIYFSGKESGVTYSRDKDLNMDSLATLLDETGNGLAIVMNRSLTETGTPTNLNAYALACVQEVYTGDILNSDKTAIENEKRNQQIASKKMPDMDASGDYVLSSNSFVNDNIFVWDDINKDGEVVHCIANNFYENFKTREDVKEEYDKLIAYGFQAILDEIDSENFYLELAEKDERIASEVSVATAFRYILNYGDKRTVVKTSLRVLDIEPYDASMYSASDLKKNLYTKMQTHDRNNNARSITEIVRDNFDKDWFIQNIATQFRDKKDEVAVVTMGTREFIGNRLDLNDEYDLIHIGMDTALMHTEVERIGTSGNSYRKTDITLYNDSNMKGMVYTHVGDTLAVVDNGYGMTGTHRISGNDITKDKVVELKRYVKSGYAVLLSDEFFNGTTGYEINTDKLDKESNLYRFVKWAVDDDNGFVGKNVHRESNFMPETGVNHVANCERFVKYLNISKLELEAISVPEPYNNDDEETTQNYLAVDGNGQYVLDYTIKLKNDAAVDMGNTTYDCKLYIDLDTDGKYEEHETLSGLDIRESGSDDSETMNSDDKYELRAGHKYHISRVVPDGYVGFLSWKLVFSQNERVFNTDDKEMDLIRTSISGYSAVPATSVVPEIKVLQICSGSDEKGGHFNLKSNDMASLYSQVRDFELSVDNITQISAKDYINKTSFPELDYLSYLSQYNMVIMGFADVYDFSGDTGKCKEAILGIRKYALSGRSILFSHDLNSYADYSGDTPDSGREWGFYCNKYLRDIQGMDRYGVTNLSSITELPEYQSEYDTAKIDFPKTNSTEVEKSGYSDAAQIRYGKSYNDYVGIAKSISQTYNQDCTKVSMVNSGQITEYPFDIPDVLDVATTHSQYMQLNMDTNSYDSNTNDDIVVWFTLGNKKSGSGSFYNAIPNDVRNMYYIYNKGNVTYTGAGHSDMNKQDEMKLFVNTMVASYNSGVRAPSVVYKEGTRSVSADISSVFVPYDPNMEVATDKGAYISNTVRVNFKTVNNNLQDNTGNLYTKYYVELEGGTLGNAPAGTDIVINGKYLKEVTPLNFREISGDGSEIPCDAYNLKNYTLYTTEFRLNDLGLVRSENGLSFTRSCKFYVRIGTEALPGENQPIQAATESLNLLNVNCAQLFELE